jgi:hypothetical protein
MAAGILREQQKELHAQQMMQVTPVPFRTAFSFCSQFDSRQNMRSATAKSVHHEMLVFF